MVSQEARSQYLIFLIGPPAVGKTSVGKALVSELDYTMIGNEDIPNFISQWLNKGDTGYWPLVSKVRRDIFEGVASSYSGGLVIEYLWDFDQLSDQQFVESIIELFEQYLWKVIFVELQSRLGTRLARRIDDARNSGDSTNEERLEEEIMESTDYRYNSPGEFPLSYPAFKIDTTELTVDDVVSTIINYLN